MTDQVTRSIARSAAGNGDGLYQIVRADPAQRSALASIMAAAFDNDAVSSWLFPDPRSREPVQRRFFFAVLDLVFSCGEVYTTADGHGASLWMSVDPGGHENEDTSEFDERIRAAIGDYSNRFAVLSARMDRSHPVQEKHKYLMFVGVAPEHQNSGIGTHLLRHHLDTLDETRTAAYLEASCPQNQKLYERLGFRPLRNRISLPDGPHLVPMWRPASTQ